MRKPRIVCSTLVAVMIGAANASAGDPFVVSPPTLDLSLANGESSVEQVSLTVNVFCIRPIDVEVVASDAGAQVTNLTGVLENTCGGDITAFDVEITGTGAAQNFDLQFVDAEFGGVLALIPVTITPTILPCSLEVALAHDGAVLGLSFDLYSGPELATWGSALWVSGNWVPLFQVVVPAELDYDDGTRIAFPPLGSVLLLSWLVDGNGQILCVDIALVNTGGGEDGHAVFLEESMALSATR